MVYCFCLTCSFLKLVHTHAYALLTYIVTHFAFFNVTWILSYLLQYIYSEESDESATIFSCDSDDEPIDYFDDNPELPIYYKRKLGGVPVIKVAKILLSPKLVHSEKVATNKPVAVSKNVAFVFDNRHFKNTKDILSDSLGVWECTGTKTFHCT